MCVIYVLTGLFDVTHASCNLSCNKCELMEVKIVLCLDFVNVLRKKGKSNPMEFHVFFLLTSYC
jgi:hypothetical protein